ncbi:acetyl-CoA carboxylase carboxyltransferase subunit alpha/beta [Kitasatospora sp. NBC_01287]|uniref:carboxyl transferase domain-containing protein n=1 Tax=Kitasatospora sp. NBC_01287 TaxID=2903573 RepID=UPI002252C80F|nr:carboxyl transferase domain-containing protein [Kitasatospora sp. NBC_01287]MCX4745565.1 acetyl-CoA carboxylase carboxyltransferase subunit alpha/beta [Kitasatospora sp. NBC_01287]
MDEPTPTPVVPAALVFAGQVLDADSFRSWDEPPRYPDDGPSYADDLARARARSGADEAALTGEGRIGGHRVAVLLSEFTFLAGSIGTATAARLLRAVERATAERLPLIAFPASGGTRMQEGTPAFVRMIAIANAVAAHKAAGLPYLVHLRHPTTGGVLASWGSLGQLTTAEPGALVGFLGPRVYQALYGAPFPEGVQRAEHLARFGTVDAVLPAGELRQWLTAALELLACPRPPAAEPSGPPASVTKAAVPVWESVARTRRPDRPGLAELLAGADTVVPLSGTGAGERDDALRLALARFGDRRCVVVGHDRAAAAAHGPVGPGALRTARRGMRLAAELRLPLLTVIDTHGALLSRSAEEGALAGEIARCVAELSALPVPVVSLLLGEGAGGAALALLPADRAIAAEHAWLSPLPPEGASVILHRTPDRAPQLAEQQRIGAVELAREGVVDRVLPEPQAPAEFIQRAIAAVREELAHAAALTPPGPRLARFRDLAR